MIIIPKPICIFPNSGLTVQYLFAKMFGKQKIKLVCPHEVTNCNLQLDFLQGEVGYMHVSMANFELVS